MKKIESAVIILCLLFLSCEYNVYSIHAFCYISTTYFSSHGIVKREQSIQAVKRVSSGTVASEKKREKIGKTDYDVFDGDRLEADELRQRALDRRRITLNSGQNRFAEKDDPEWKFFDTARINVSGGDGGNGCIAFRRERGEAMGGPYGGKGGKGGSVFLVCDEKINTLAAVRNKVHIRGSNGHNGLGKNKDGPKGTDQIIYVPPGTIVRELKTQKVAGELKDHGDTLLVAKGGRGGRGNFAFANPRSTAPKIAEKGEPGANRWLSLELKLVADVGFLGKPNAGKSTLLASATAARPKIADYPFTTIVPNLGICDISEEGAGLVLCDIPGLIEGASSGIGLGYAFLRHVQRCKVLLHIIDGTSDDPIGDFQTINEELRKYDEFLSKKPQVVVLNKIDVPQVKENQEKLLNDLRQVAGHNRVLSISAVTTERVQELMGRLKKFVMTQPDTDLPLPPEIDVSKSGLEFDSDDYDIISDPAYPGQWRVLGNYIEQIAKMTHWEYPEAVERFDRILQRLGISAELERRGAKDGDLVMVGEYDFDFAPGLTNPYIPVELLEQDTLWEQRQNGRAMLVDEDINEWRPFRDGGYLDDDSEELEGFSDSDEWSFLLKDDTHGRTPVFPDSEVDPYDLG